MKTEMKLLPGSSVRHPSVAGKSDQDVNQPSDTFHDQITFVKVMQEKIERNLTKITLSNSEDEIKEVKRNLKVLKSRSRGMLVLIQVMLKVKNELTHAKFDLERAIKIRQGIEQAQKRVNWLEARLHKLLLASKAICTLKEEEHSKQDNFIQTNDLRPTLAEGYREDEKARLCHKKRSLPVSPDQGSAMLTKEMVEASVVQVLPSTIQGDAIAPDEKLERASLLTDQYLSDPDVLAQESPRRSVDSDPVSEYWNSDHHRYDWTNFMQKLDPLSWHAIPISYPDSFLKKGPSLSVSELPWKRKPKLTEPADFHKLALEKLQKKLQKMYEMIENTTLHSVDDKTSPTLDSRGGHRSPRHWTKNISFHDEKGNRDGRDTVFKSPGLELYDERTIKLTSRPGSVTFPVVKQDPNRIYPRPPTIWCDTNRVHFSNYLTHVRSPRDTLTTLPRINNQRPKHRVGDRRDTHTKMKIASRKVRALALLRTKTASASTDENDLKWRRIQDLLGDSGINSEHNAIALDSMKNLAQLGCDQDSVIDALVKKVEEQKEGILGYEASKALLRLGVWDTLAIKILTAGLEEGNRDLKFDILKAILQAKNAQFIKRVLPAHLKRFGTDVDSQDCNAFSNPETTKLCNVLASLVSIKDEDISLEAAICLGHMCITDVGAKQYLLGRLDNASFKVKARPVNKRARTMLKCHVDNCQSLVFPSRLCTEACQHTLDIVGLSQTEALQALVKQMNWKSPKVISALLDQLNSSTNWKHRTEAADLLCHIGPKHVTEHEESRMFDISERLLWDHPCKEVREKMAKILDSFGMRQRACLSVDKRLDDIDETTRIQGIISLVSLRLKGERELKTLLDMLELDSSLYVRIQVIRAFHQLEWNDARVIRSLQEREKGEGALAVEARNVLKVLASLPQVGSR